MGHSSRAGSIPAPGTKQKGWVMKRLFKADNTYCIDAQELDTAYVGV